MNENKPAKAARPDTAVARTIARTIFTHAFNHENPDATPGQRKEAWKAASTDYMPLGRAVANGLRKSGYTIEKRPQPAK